MESSEIIPSPRANVFLNDNSTLITIVVSFCVAVIIVELCFRAYSVYLWHRQRHTIKRDDVVFFMAAGLAFCEVVLVIVQTKHGWGKSTIAIPRINIRSREDIMYKTGYAADLFYVTVLACSKICVAIFNRDIFRRVQRVPVWIIDGAMLFTGASWVASILTLAVRCTSAPWANINHQCSSFLPHWRAVTALDIATEVPLLIYPTMCLYWVQLCRPQKICILAAVNCRILIIPLSGLHLYFIHVQNKSPFPSVDGTFATIIANIHLTFSLVFLIGSSLKRLISIPYQRSDFIVPSSPNNTNTTARRSTSKSILYRSLSSLSSSSSTTNSNPERISNPVVLDRPRLPYARQPPATSHETWPRWSVIEEEEEEAASPATAAAADEDYDRREESSIHLPPPPPVLKREKYPSRTAQGVERDKFFVFHEDFTQSSRSGLVYFGKQI